MKMILMVNGRVIPKMEHAENYFLVRLFDAIVLPKGFFPGFSKPARVQVTGREFYEFEDKNENPVPFLILKTTLL